MPPARLDEASAPALSELLFAASICWIESSVETVLAGLSDAAEQHKGMMSQTAHQRPASLDNPYELCPNQIS
jgi:hypothetical protein